MQYLNNTAQSIINQSTYFYLQEKNKTHNENETLK